MGYANLGLVLIGSFCRQREILLLAARRSAVTKSEYSIHCIVRAKMRRLGLERIADGHGLA
jgi:hypothetical protein